MKRFLIGAFVVGFWLIMMGSLVWEQSRLRRQEEKSHEMPTSELGRQWEDVEEWMEIVSQGSRIGVAGPDPDPGGGAGGAGVDLVVLALSPLTSAPHRAMVSGSTHPIPGISMFRMPLDITQPVGIVPTGGGG